MNKPVDFNIPFYFEKSEKKEIPKKEKNRNTLPDGAMAVEKGSREYHFLVGLFWGVKERVDSVLNRIYIDEAGHFMVNWKKRGWGKLETVKIFKRYSKQ